MSFLYRFFTTTTPSPAATMAAKQKAQQLIDDNAVMVFSKSWCPHCRNSKRILEGLGAKYTAYELNEESMCTLSLPLSPSLSLPLLFLPHLPHLSRFFPTLRAGADGDSEQATATLFSPP